MSIDQQRLTPRIPVVMLQCFEAEQLDVPLLGRCLQIHGVLLSCACTGSLPCVLCLQVAACGAAPELCSAAVLDAPLSSGLCAQVREVLSAR